MKVDRIKTVMLHSWYHLSHSMETIIDNFWFPLISFVVFSMIASFIADDTQIKMIVFGSIFWIAIEVSQYSVSVSALWEIWSRSFSSLFISPLKLSEYLIGNMIMSIFKSIAIFIILSIAAFIFFKVSVLDFGLMLIVYYMLLLMFGWSAGMFTLGLVFKHGTNIQSLAWSLIFIIQPIGAVFYPLSLLPKTIQYVSRLFPVTYIFESIRQQITTNTININYLLIAFFLNIIFLTLSYIWLNNNRKLAKKKGTFVRLEM
jgi:ABC-2 type transport system permease protein